MMTSIRTFALWLVAVSVATAGELKVATVDIQRLSEQYSRAQEVIKELKEREANLNRELEGLRLQGVQLAKEAEALKNESQEPALNANERDLKKRTLELRLADLRAFQVRYEDTQAQRNGELRNQAEMARKRVLNEIVAATRRVADAEGYNLVLNQSLTNPGLSDVIHSKGVRDLTDVILSDLNAVKTVIPDKPQSVK